MLIVSRQERQAIIFFTVIVLAGVGIRHLGRLYAPARKVERLIIELGRVDLNTADKRALKTVKGIGEALAERIIAYRQENGPYSSVDDLRRVPGITRSRYERIRDAVTTGEGK